MQNRLDIEYLQSPKAEEKKRQLGPEATSWIRGRAEKHKARPEVAQPPRGNASYLLATALGSNRGNEIQMQLPWGTPLKHNAVE